MIALAVAVAWVLVGLGVVTLFTWTVYDLNPVSPWHMLLAILIAGCWPIALGLMGAGFIMCLWVLGTGPR